MNKPMLLCLVFLLSACAITVKVPVNRFDTPETIGKQFRVKLGGAYVGAADVVLTPDYLTVPPTLTNPGLSGANFVRDEIGLSILKNLDVELKGFNTIQGKYQLAGHSRYESVPNDFSAAVTLSAGYSSDPYSGTFGNTTVNGTNTDIPIDTAFLAGYRFNRFFLLYGGPFVRTSFVSGTYNPTGNPSLVSTSYSGTVLSVGSNIGIEVGTPLLQVRFEGGAARIAAGNLTQSIGFVGAEFAFTFGGHQFKEPEPERKKTPDEEEEEEE